LAKIGEAAVPAVARVLAGGPFDARDAAAEILGKIASTSGAARAALEAALADPAPEIRLSVLKELWRGTKDPRAVVPGLLELVRSGPESCRATAAYHLSQIGSGASFAIRELRAAHARAGDEQVATYLARAIEAVEWR
jgi:HEAT repeat protein